jgi:predicted PurR-regulated permease PerM
VPQSAVRNWERGLSKQRYRRVLVAGAVLFGCWLLWSARESLYPFMAGAIFAFVLAPIVDLVVSVLPFRKTRPALAVGLAVAYVYLVSILLLVGIGVQLVPRAGSQARELTDGVPAMVERAREQFERSATWYEARVPEPVKQQVEKSSQELAGRAAEIGAGILERIVMTLTGGVSSALAYIVVPFWLFYVLKDREQAARAFYNLFPTSVRPDVQVMSQRASAVLGSFIRAQLLLSTVTGVVTWIGLALLGVKFSLILGVINGIANLIPVLGPMLGGIPILIVTAATRPGWDVLWVFLFLFISQNLKDYILVPRVQGQAVHMHPAIILVLLVIAGHIAGFWGLLVAVPLAAVARDCFLHIYRRLSDDPSPPVALLTVAEEQEQAA